MKTLHVDLGLRSYPIYIAQQALSAQRLQQHIVGSEVVIISNTTVAALYLKTLQHQLLGFKVLNFNLEDGECYKNLNSVQQIYDFLLENRVSRSATIIALGGGVVGDIAGFAAATYQRGINFIQIPTTLLSQVDSSVGGKTGVNHALGKNMIGAFYQPQAVFIELEFLKTLETQQYIAGIAEIIKYALLGDVKLYKLLQQEMPALLQQQADVLIDVIQSSCANKARIVAEDEREAGRRALLNLGHTFGHAIETLEQYKGLIHGEAVAVGMLMAADMSQRMGYIDAAQFDDINTLIQSAGLPTQVPSHLDKSAFRAAMNLDKKTVAGALRLILLKEIGQAYIESEVQQNILDQTLAAFMPQ